MFNDNWTTDEHALLIATIVKSLQSLEGEIVEIGVWEGKMTVSIANSAYPEFIHCIDWWKGNVAESEASGQKHVTEILLETRDVKTIFEGNIKELTNQNVHLHSLDCNEWLKECTLSIKFCYLDASHDYASVKETLELLLPRLVMGGVICGSDFLSAGNNRQDLQGGVQRAVQEILPRAKNVDNVWLYQHK